MVFLFYKYVVIMSLSRGLVISLGVSALGCTLLFLYFRSKIAGIERKVDVMFDLIQNHQFVQAEPVSVSSNTTVRRENEEWTDNNNNLDTQTNEVQEINAWGENAKSEDDLDLIQVSEDDDDDDSEEISDTDDDEDDDEQPKLSLDQTEDMSLSLSDIKKITVQETDNLQVDNTIELEEIDSLDEIEDDDDDDDDIVEAESQKVTVIKDDDDVDYAKLKVTELKALAEAKGLSNYKSLKKSPLIDLLKGSE